MATEATVSDVTDPLSGLIGPSLFPRSIKASADVPLPFDPKDLDSIHNFMKSLELRSPEKLNNEAKRIVDGGAELLKSNLSSFAENVGTAAAAPALVDRPRRERRPGLNLPRTRVPFSLKPEFSEPQVIMESCVDLNTIDDPDEFWDAYDRMEKAKKEIQRQLGGNIDDFALYKPVKRPRVRRQGIFGKRYHYTHRYPLTPTKDNEALMSSQEIVDEKIPSAPNDNSQETVDGNIPSAPKDNSREIVDEAIPSAPKDNAQEIVDEDIMTGPKDPNPDTSLKEDELAGSTKKSENEFSNILKEMLSCNLEDLQGVGALNILQERLDIKPIDLESLGMTHDVGRTSISAMPESFRKSERSSLIIDSVFKYLNKKSTVEHECVANQVNPVTSPTPPQSPFASLSLLKKKILQPNPLRDPFSPVDVELSECPNASSAKPQDKVPGQVDAPNDLCMSSELEPHSDVSNMQPLISDLHEREMMGNTAELPMQLVDENANIQNAHADSSPFEEPDNNIERPMDFDENELNPSVLEEEARDDMSIRQQTDPEQQPEVNPAKVPKKKGIAGEKRIRNAHPMRKSLAAAGTSFETGVRRSKRIKMRPLEYWKGERFLFGHVDGSLKLLGVKYISPGKVNENLKVKPYIPVQSSKYKELLELAGRH